MAEPKVDFYVIYNRAMTRQAETDDCILSLNFTEHLVRVLEQRGHKGHYDDRDAIGGSNIFKELFRNVKETRKTILVVTPGFLKNCWAQYSSMAAFKELIDTNKCSKLIPIGIGIEDHQKLQELNIKEWIHLLADWSPDKNPLQWNIIIKSVSHDGPLSTEPSYREYIHDQEHGDNKLRSDQNVLVVQPDSLQAQSTDFFNEKFLLYVATHFLTDWHVLALNLGLKDETVKEVELNNLRNVRMQAYNALLRWKKASRESQEKKVTTLLSVVMEMGRKDLAEDIETKYNEFASQNESRSEGFDEVDMGMSRNRENNLYLQKAQPKLFDQSEQLIFERSNDAGDSTQCKTYMTRELKPETTAFVDLKTNSKSHTQSSDSLAIQPGPAMSLPPAPMVSLPPSTPIKELSHNAANTQQTDRTQDAVNILENSNSDRGAGGGVLNEETHSNTGGPKAMEYIPVEDRISASQTEALNTQINMPDTQRERQPPDDRNVNCNPAVNGEHKYNSQESLSKDTDLSADAYGSFSYDKKPNSLHLYHSSPSSSNYVSRNANDAVVASPDSGYGCSAAQTPLNEQIIPNKGNQSVEAVPTVLQNKGNQSMEADSALKQNKGNQSQEAVPAVIQNKGNQSKEAVPAVIPSKGNQSQEAVQALIQKTDNQAETSQEMSVKQTSQESNDAETSKKSTSNTGPQNKRPPGSDDFEGEGTHVEKSTSELDTSLSATQGEPQSLGSRVLHSFISMLTRPELAYS